jgi:DNA helicase-2/ATP-dependent DNA helicase PcrA
LLCWNNASNESTYLTYAETRRINGSETYNRVSRFVGEIPAELVQEVRLSNIVTRPAMPVRNHKRAAMSGAMNSEVDGTELRLGQRINHAKFGEGTILNYEGQGKQARIQVNFDNEGSKWLMLAYATLLPCS